MLSSEQSRAIAWGDDDDGTDTEGDSDGASTDSEKVDSDRFYHFEVAKTKDQEENVVVRAGFTVGWPCNIVSRSVISSNTISYLPQDVLSLYR